MFCVLRKHIYYNKVGRKIPCWQWGNLKEILFGEYLFVSNYTSGSLSVFRLDVQRGTMRLVEYKQHTGSGKHPERQEGPHVHFSKLIGDRCLQSIQQQLGGVQI